MRTLSIVALTGLVACTRASDGRPQVASTSAESVRATVTSVDSVMASLDAYSKKRISAAAASKVIVHYIIATGQPLNLSIDAALRDAVTREMKARGR